MTEVSKEAVNALAEAGAIMFAPNNIWKAAELTAFGLEKRGYTIAPIAPVTDEKLREAVDVGFVGEAWRKVRKFLREQNDTMPGTWGAELSCIESALSELSQLRATSQAVVARWDSPKWKDLPATAEFINAMRELLPTPPKEDL